MLGLGSSGATGDLILNRIYRDLEGWGDPCGKARCCYSLESAAGSGDHA